ncbi:alpha/beta fold hydrolase [Eubacteriales bacterium KG127]
MSKVKMSDGCDLFYEEKGNGEPLIFVHGWSANSTYFKKQMNFFADYYRVVTYDLRGHGQSDRRPEITEKNMTMERLAQDLKELTDYLGLSNINVCGWSMGVSILLCYIGMYGCEKLNTLSLIDMTPKLLNDEEWNLGDFDAYENLVFTRDIATNWEDVIHEALPEMFARDINKESQLYKWVEHNMANNVPHVMSALWLAMALGDYRDVLPSITIPTFLAYSSGGDMYGPEHGEYMNKNIQNSKLVIFENCGHSLYMENSKKFNGDYHEFLIDNSLK